jgi:ribonuclease E
MGRERDDGAPTAYERTNEGDDEQHAFDSAESAEELTEGPAKEADLVEAVADLDAPPTEAPPPAEPADMAAAQASPVVPQQESPRRRSTVREPAPMTAASEISSQPTPIQPPATAQQPVVTEIGESETADRPRRSGWWSRRFAGG